MEQITLTLETSTALMLAIPAFLSALSGVFAALASFLPPPIDSSPSWYVFLHRIVNRIGWNVRHAENKQ